MRAAAVRGTGVSAANRQAREALRRRRSKRYQEEAMRYQCADCGQGSETPFRAVYRHWAAPMVIMRCPDCAERWDNEVEPVLAKVNANGRDGGKGRRSG